MDNDGSRRKCLTGGARLAGIAACCLVLIVIRRVDAENQGESLSLHGVLDWTGHLLTAGIVAIGLSRWSRPSLPLMWMLVGALLPDAGHLLTALDLAEPISGSSRNGTHSALAIGAIMVLATVDRARCSVWLGISIGAASHLWRDMGTGTIPLFWPWSDRVYSVRFAHYLVGALVTGLILLALGAIQHRPLNAVNRWLAR